MSLRAQVALISILALAAGCKNDPPAILAIDPQQGPLAGGTSISVVGVNFDEKTLLFVGGQPCSNLSLVSSGSLTGTTPAGAQLGAYTVTVKNSDGQRDHVKNGFTYTDGASGVAVSSVSPTSGSSGTTATITGSGFAANATVQFGSADATSVNVQSSTTITCIVPSGTGTVTVTVTNTDGGTGNLPNAFSYGSGSGTKTITAFAGTGTAGFSGDGGQAAQATFSAPRGLALASDGSIYVADTGNNRVRKIDPTNVISTVAGSAGELNGPQGVGLDTTGNLFIADTGNHVIRKLAAGTLTVVAGVSGSAGSGGDGGAATSAQLNGPTSVSVDGSGNILVADTQNNVIRKVDGAAQTISVFAGTGAAGLGPDTATVATSCALSSPSGVLVDSTSSVYIADTGNARVRRVQGDTITTFAGGGTSQPGDGNAPTQAVLTQPFALAEGSSGIIVIADPGANIVRDISANVIQVLAGNYTAGNAGDGGAAASANLNSPHGVAASTNGQFFIADTGNNRIRKVQ